MRGWRWSLALGLGVVAACAANLGSGAAEADVGASVLAPVVVRVATVAAPEATRDLVVHGVSRAAQRSRLSFPSGGRLLGRAVGVGDHVDAGTTLAWLDPAPFAHQADAAEAQVRELSARLQGLTADQARLASLQEGRMVSRTELDQVDTQVSALTAALQAAQTAAAEARRQAADARLVAPFSGRVLAVGAEPGETVAPGQAVVELSGDGQLEVEVQVPESVWGQLQVGSPARVHLSALGRQVQGAITQVAAAARPEGLFPVVVAFDDDGLAAGLTTSVQLQLPVVADATLPVAAIVDPTGGAPVVLQIVDGVAHRVPVAPHHLLAEGVAVTGALRPGDEVVVSGHGRLLDGDVVEVIR